MYKLKYVFTIDPSATELWIYCDDSIAYVNKYVKNNSVSISLLLFNQPPPRRSATEKNADVLLLIRPFILLVIS